MFEYRLLGSVEVRVDGRPVDVGPAKQRSVLAVLLVEANTAVSVDQLIDRVWADHPPPRVRSSLHSYLTGLRRVLRSAPVSITGRSGTYVLAVDEHAVDLHQFRHLMDQARAETDDERALVLAERALGLWRGEPFAGLDAPWLATVRAGLERERAAAQLDHVDLALRCGQHTRLLPELSTLADENPLDEWVSGQLMLALYRAGRQADALAHYQHTRQHLAEQLGTDPGPELQQLHQRILTADPSLTPTATNRVSAGAGTAVVPRQLPAAPWAFTGRQEHLDALTATLDQTGTVVISAIRGAGGIGKTWLALAWAHRHLDQFPDGQLFVDLRGFSPDSEPMAPAVALRGFLDALGVAPARIPLDLQARSGLLRSLVAHKRMLIVLDNAADADQVVPLLPGGDSCTVLVNSRRTLTGLITRHGAHHIALDTLSDDEARALLARRLGAARVAAEPEAVTKLLRLCGGLPLALGIIAAHALVHPELLLAEFVAALDGRGFNAFHDDPTTSLTAVLSWSYRALTTQQQVGFGLLGIAPGPDISLPAAASLTGQPPAQAAIVLRGLQEASLLGRDTRGRYSMHDLIRRYATDTAHHQLPDDLREAALRRVIDFYTHTADTADQLLNPYEPTQRIDPPAPGCHPHALPDSRAALAWFDTEHPCLLAAQHTAATHHWHRTVWHLAWNLTTLHLLRGHRRDELTAWQTGLAAAEHLHDHAAHAVAHLHLGHAYTDLERHDEAIRHLHQSLTLAEHHHDHTGQAHAHRALAWAWGQREDNRRALEHATHALRIARTLDDPVWEARALNTFGWFAARLGDHDQASDHCQAALTLFHRHPDPDDEANALDNLGYIGHHTGNHHQAIHHYHQAVTRRRDLGAIYQLADTLGRLGQPHAALGQRDQARAIWREALQLYRDQGRHDDADRIQRQLAALDHANTDHVAQQDQVD
jgi:DNA-binding SARP family transcriptional activator/tetratricopeptide (TPR) repeat protein